MQKRSEDDRRVSYHFLTTGNSSHPLLREYIFFCGRYINDVISTQSKCKDLFWDYFRNATCSIFCKEPSTIAAQFIRFNDQLLENGSKIYIPGYLRRNLVSELIDKWFDHQGDAIAFGNEAHADGIPSADKVLSSLFKSQQWNETENPADFGWWLAQSRICLNKHFVSNFASKREAVAWILLGSHYSEYDFAMPNKTQCCSKYTRTPFDKKLFGIISGLSLEDRVSTVKMIIYKASEFGVCSNLGAALTLFLCISGQGL